MPETKPLEEKIQKAIDKALYANGNPVAQKARNFLNGTWLGVPLHVVAKRCAYRRLDRSHGFRCPGDDQQSP